MPFNEVDSASSMSGLSRANRRSRAAHVLGLLLKPHRYLAPLPEELQFCPYRSLRISLYILVTWRNLSSLSFRATLFSL
jgi:hypothetical protein